MKEIDQETIDLDIISSFPHYTYSLTTIFNYIPKFTPGNVWCGVQFGLSHRQHLLKLNLYEQWINATEIIHTTTFTNPIQDISQIKLVKGVCTNKYFTFWYCPWDINPFHISKLTSLLLLWRETLHPSLGFKVRLNLTPKPWVISRS